MFAAGVYPLAIVVRRPSIADNRSPAQIHVQRFVISTDHTLRIGYNAQVAAETLTRLGDSWWPIFSPTIEFVERCLCDTIALAELADIAFLPDL